MNQKAYEAARETMRSIFKMPEAERKTVLDMMRGAVAISELYAASKRQEEAAARPSA